MIKYMRRKDDNDDDNKKVNDAGEEHGKRGGVGKGNEN